MSGHSEADRETRRALLREALDQLRDAPDDRSSDDVVRALDAYLDAREPSSPARSAPTVKSDLDRNERHEIRWITWMILGVAVLATLLAVVTISSGGVTGVVIVAIWLVAAFAMLNT